MLSLSRTLCRIATAVAFILCAAGVASAQAPTGTVDADGAATITAGQSTFTVAYSMTGTGVSNARIQITVPAGVFIQNVAAPLGVTQTNCSGQNCTLNLNFTSGGVSGQATITATMNPFVHPDGAMIGVVANLLASYNSGSQSGTIATDTHTMEVEASPLPIFYDRQIGGSRWILNPATSEPGLAIDYVIGIYNYGSAAIDAGSVTTVTVPSFMRFVSWQSTSFPPSLVQLDAAPAPFTHGPFSVTMPNTQTYSTSYFNVTYWIPCSELPKTTATVALAFAGTWQSSDGVDDTSTSYNIVGLPAASQSACGEGGGASKDNSARYSNQVGEGDNITWTVGAQPPNGTVVVNEAVIVDRIPAKVVLVSASAPVPADFVVYYCVLPAETGNFTATQFLTTYRTNGCSTTAPSPIATTTHLVWYAQEWGDATDGISAFGGSYVINAPLDTFVDDEPVTNVAVASGTSFGSDTPFSFTVQDTIRVRTVGELAMFLLTNPQTPRSPGSQFAVSTTTATALEWARVRNPVVTLTLPVGVRYDASLPPIAPNFTGNGSCNWNGPLPIEYDTAPTVVTNGDGTQTLTWRIGTVTSPTRLPLTCLGYQGGYAAANPLYLSANLRIDPTVQLLNGTQLTLVQRAWGDNAVMRETSNIVVVSSPAEMRTDVQPDCSPEEEPSLLVTYQNSGGVELTNVSVTVSIPKSTDTSGTEVDTTFVRVDNQPAGTTLEYFVSGSWVGTVPGNLALVERVRLNVTAAMPGFSGQREFNIVLDVPDGTPVGTYIRGSSVMQSSQLGQLASANSAPIKVDLCPGILGVHTFFDTNGNNVQDEGEPDMPAWDLTVTDIEDPLTILDWTTDINGDYQQQLSPATYSFEVFPPTPDPYATWVFTTPPDTMLDSNDETILPIAIGCTCNDNSGCTADSCYLGVCTFVEDDNSTAVDDTCDGFDDDCDGFTDEEWEGAPVGCGDGVCAVEGETVCEYGNVYVVIGGNYYNECQPNYEWQSNEVCDELDNDCDGEVDNNLGLGEECTVGNGPCMATGVYVCADQTVTCNAVSEVQPTTEVCDNIDNDCSGEVDDAIEPEYTSCGTGGCFAAGALVCYQGTTVFIEDYFGGNNGRIDPISFPERCEPNDDNRTAESCDSFDNDCDGFVDDGFGVGEYCESGVGQCASSGTRVCGNGVAVCNAPVIGPGVERCDDQLDSDCDGRNNNGFELIGQACNAAGGAEDADNCINDVYVCGGASLACQSVTVAVERCDGLDNDCDGQADETFVGGFWQLGQACDGADGDKCNEGVFVCNGTQNGTTCSDNSSTNSELCNGVDDDCDGTTDEDWKVDNDVGFTGIGGRFLGQGCDGSNDADLCERGVIECSLDFTTVYCHESGVGLVELCDAAGADEDCDGSVNEGFDLGLACMTDGEGACSVPGTIACADDNATTTCVATVPNEGSAEVCNGIDDDCDGGVDNVPETQTSICAPIETDILTGPAAITAATTATFTYVNPLASPVASHTTFQCSLDGGAWTTCNHSGASPSLNYANLPSGPHTLLVRATRADGSFDATPDVWTWVIDTTVPETTIVSAPTNPAQTPTGTIVFGSPTPGTFSCVLDPAGGACPASGAPAYGACTNPYPFTNLAEGPHTICVYVTNTAGTVDPTPASYTWVIDLSAPETEIVATIPPKATNETTVTFNYVDPDAPATNTFECSLDGSAWVDCDGKTTTYSDLAEGEHTFDVRTVDNNGIVDPTPASYSFVVDLTAPCTTVTTRPADPSQSDAALFAFSSDEAGSVFMCSLDGATAAACSAVTSLSGLAEGTHTLVVYAVDMAGNASVGDCRVTVAWTIDTRFPETEITSGPTVLVGSGEDVTVTYVDPTDDALLTFECSLDGAAFVRCDGTTAGEGGSTEYGALPVGTHTFVVRACDLSIVGAPQCDPTPATTTWEVTTSPCPNDRTAPTLVCAEDLVLECVDGGASIDLGDMTPAITDACAPVATTTSASAEVSLGQTPVVFSGTDGNGNRSSCVTLVTVVDVTKPTAVCPADIEVGTDAGVCTAAVAIGAATGDDACQGNVGLLHINDAPTAFIPGETVVTHHVIDAAGNEATCQQRVTVVDDEDLTLTCSASDTVDAPADACSWTGTRSALATDNCSDELTVDVTGTYPVGMSPVLFTAADAAGNTAECTTELTVRDVTRPVVVCGTPVGTLPTIITASATDACGATVTLQNVVCAKVVDGVSSNVPLADCPVAIDGASLEVDGRLVDGELAVTYEARAVDAAGNEQVTTCTYGNAADRDGDGIVDGDDNCPADANTDQRDGDNDGVGDACDICPTTNDDQTDGDDDGVGDACSDKDRDGVLDIEDNCPADANADQLDADGDELGDVCDPTPYDGVTAEGAGGCAGGSGGLAALLMGLAIVVRRRIKATKTT